MSLLTVTAKGQVTFRKDVLRHLGVRAGEKIAVDLLPDGTAAIRAARTGGSIDAFIGCLHRPGEPAHSLDEIEAAIADGWTGIGRENNG